MDNILKIDDTSLLEYFDSAVLKEIDADFKQSKFAEIISSRISLERIEKCSSIFPKQILLSIHIFSALKIQKYDYANKLFYSFNFKDKTIFPLLFLQGKYYMQTNDTSNALKVFNAVAKRYENSTEIASIEENSVFQFFGQFFENMFSIKDTANKLKKCYFEIKNCLNKLGFPNEAYRIMEKCYNEYPDDIIVLFEMFKESCLVSNLIRVEELFGKMKKKQSEAVSSSADVQVYENYLNFAEAFMWISKCEYEIAKNKFTEIARNNQDNIIVMNNIAIMNFYLNRIDKCYYDLGLIMDKDEMNCLNEITMMNYNLLADNFNYTKNIFS